MRKKQVETIGQFLQLVHDISEDINKETKEQGKIITEIEKKTDKTQMHTESAKNQLQEANEKQEGGCFIFWRFLFIIAITRAK